MSNGFIILPPGDNKCPICAITHDVDQPHDATSFYYRFLFKNQYGRDATWADAMLHCPDKIKQTWTEHLIKIGIDINSIYVTGDIKDQNDLNERMKREN